MEIQNLTKSFAFNSLSFAKPASNLIESSSIPRRVMTISEGPTAFFLPLKEHPVQNITP